MDLHIILVRFLHLARLDSLISSQCYEEAVYFAVDTQFGHKDTRMRIVRYVTILLLGVAVQMVYAA